MKLSTSARYLLFSVNPLATVKTVLIRRNGQLLLDLSMRLDACSPTSEVAVDMARFGQGEYEIACEPDMDIPVKTADDPAYPVDLYRETWRPRVHFSAKRGWINDPNGLVWYRGVWHLFFQYNPVGCEWGNMHWGHATSTDLIRWEEQDTALFPDADGTMFSGSALVDTENRLALNTSEHEAILLFYTCAGDTSVLSKDKPFTQCLAVSLDGGSTFFKHSRNPLIPQMCAGNRDPKIIRSPAGGYVMALYFEKNTYTLLHSENLLDWSQRQTLELPDDTECPDFYPLFAKQIEDLLVHPSGRIRVYPLPVRLPAPFATAPQASDNLDATPSLWILSGAADRYLIGSFDGNTFTPQGLPGRLHWGTHAYAAQSWSDVPSVDGRRIRISWNTSDLPGTSFNRCMTIPCEMSLQHVAGHLKLCAWPIREIETLWRNPRMVPEYPIHPDTPLWLPLSHVAQDLCCTLSWEPQTTALVLALFGATLRIDVEKQSISLLGTISTGNPMVPFDAILPTGAQRLSLRIIADLTGLEIYLEGGAGWISQGHCADPNLARLTIATMGGSAQISQLKISELAGIWDAGPMEQA